MEAAELNGRHVAYRLSRGGGPCVVFVHALGSDQSIWDATIAHLGRGFDTLTYDLRGHGLSGPSDRHTIADLADDLIALLEKLELTGVILCGVSVGGMVAMSVASRRPDLVRAAILSNTATRIGDDARWNDRIASVRAGGVESVAEAILGTWFTPEFRKTHPSRWALYRALLSRNSASGYVATCAAIRDADLTDLARSITVPCLCIAGEGDRSVPPEEVERLASTIPDAGLETLADVGHLAPLEAPRRMAELIEAMAAAHGARHEAGMQTRRAVLGDDHVDRAEAAKTPFDQPFQTLITEGAWGTVWSSPVISRRERSMLTLALLAATGNFEEIPMHIRATSRTGATPRDIQEAFQHVAIYAGVPRANHALKLAKQAFADMEQHDE